MQLIFRLGFYFSFFALQVRLWYSSSNFVRLIIDKLAINWKNFA